VVGGSETLVFEGILNQEEVWNYVVTPFIEEMQATLD
jgi:hypothetical protein